MQLNETATSPGGLLSSSLSAQRPVCDRYAAAGCQRSFHTTSIVDRVMQFVVPGQEEARHSSRVHIHCFRCSAGHLPGLLHEAGAASLSAHPFLYGAPFIVLCRLGLRTGGQAKVVRSSASAAPGRGWVGRSADGFLCLYPVPASPLNYAPSPGWPAVMEGCHCGAQAEQQPVVRHPPITSSNLAYFAAGESECIFWIHEHVMAFPHAFRRWRGENETGRCRES